MKPKAKREQQRQNARDLIEKMPLDILSRTWLHQHIGAWTKKKLEANQ